MSDIKSTDYWQTPDDIVTMYCKKMQSNKFMDLCGKHKLSLYGTDDVFGALSDNVYRADWLFLNPPYSRGNIYRFLLRGIQLSNWTHRPLVALIKVCTSTKAWNLIYDYDKMCYRPGFRVEWFRSKVKFIDPGTGLPGDNPGIEVCTVYFNPKGSKND